MANLDFNKGVTAAWHLSMILAWCTDPHAPATLRGFHTACVGAAAAMLFVGAKPCSTTLHTTMVVALLTAADATDVYWWPTLVALLGVSSRVLA